MNESSKSRVAWLMIFAIIGFALLMFRQVLAPCVCLFTTDNNIGQASLGKDSVPGCFFWGSWGDTVYMGMPGGIVPVAWLSILTWLIPLKMFVNWLHAIDLIIASLFIVLFLRRQQIGWPSIAIGLLTAFWLGSNLTLTYAGHTGKFGVVMMACVALYCISRALSRSPSVLWGVLSGGAIGFMFLEQLDVALFFGFVLGAYAMFLVIRQWQTNGAWAKSAIALFLMGGVALLLAASTMFGSYASNVKGTASMQVESPREKWDYVTQWSWPPDECIDFIAPGYMGWRSGEPAGPYWGRMGRSVGWEQTRQGFMNFKLENMYLGVIPILLAFFAILAGVMGGAVREYGSNGVRASGSKGSSEEDLTIRPYTDTPIRPYAHALTRAYSTTTTRAEIIFWGCVVVVTLLLAFGKFFPLYALFYKLPLVSSIRNPNKFLQVFQLALGILAAYGLDEVLRSKRPTSNIQCRMK